MKNTRIRFSLLIAVLALTAQLSFVNAPVQAQNANSSQTMESTAPQTRPMPNLCQRRCRATYSRCLRMADGNPGRRRACLVRYRNCVRHCGRR